VSTQAKLLRDEAQIWNETRDLGKAGGHRRKFWITSIVLG